MTKRPKRPPPTKPGIASRPRRVRVAAQTNKRGRPLPVGPGYEALLLPALDARLDEITEQLEAINRRLNEQHHANTHNGNLVFKLGERLDGIGKRLDGQSGFHGHLKDMLRRLDETIALIAVMQRDQTLSLHEQQILRALTDRHRFRPTAREAEVEVDRALREYRSPNGGVR